MMPEPPLPWDADLRQDLHRRGDRIAVDVDAALRAVERRTNRRQQRRRHRRSLGAVLAAAAAIVAIMLAGRVLEGPVRQTSPTSAKTGHQPPIALPHGTFSYRLSPRDLRAASDGHVSQHDITNNAGTWTWTLNDGQWDLNLKPSSPDADPAYPCSGTLTVDGDVATFVRTVNQNPEGECAPVTWSARFAVQGRIVHWSAVSIPGFASFFATRPWTRR